MARTTPFKKYLANKSYSQKCAATWRRMIMLAFKLISVFIFNGLSKLVHKRSSLGGEPYQLPYPRKSPGDSLQTENLAEFSADKPITDETSKYRRTSPRAKTCELVEVIDDDDLLRNEYKLKQFLLRTEEDILKLLEDTGEGVKVPRPVPYPNYLKRPPDIPVALTHAAVLRRLYNDERIVRTVPSRIISSKKFPKKPPVPKYHEPEVIEVRQKAVRLSNGASDIQPTTTTRRTPAQSKARKR